MKHSEAKKLVDTLGLTPQESLALRAVAWHETKYGEGWKDPAHDKKNNMGAITTTARTKDDPSTPENEGGQCLPQDFSHGDSRRSGEGGEGGEVIQYTTCFKGASTPLEGFQILANTLYKQRPAVRAAAAKGLYEVATEMRNTSYYLGTAKTRPEQIQAYYSALQNGAELIATNTGEPWPWKPSSGKAPSPAASVQASSSLGSPGRSFMAQPAQKAGPLPVLRPGYEGDGVALFFLIALRHPFPVYMQDHIPAVKRLQQSLGLKEDGIVGPKTWAALLKSFQ